jgi:hypothetical protein
VRPAQLQDATRSRKERPRATWSYLLDDEEDDPLGLVLEDEDPPLIPPLLEVEPPVPEELMLPPLDEPIPPLDEELPVPLELEVSGELGAVAVDDDEDPPGTTTVSFSFVVLDELAEPVGAVLLPPGTTVVDSLRSQADRAKAPIRTNT